jgi:maleate isomerase
MFAHMTGHNNMVSTDDRLRSCEKREYGRNGLFGILTPQGNPTAEPELGILLPAGSVILAARLTSASPSLRERLVDYGCNLSATVASFGDIAFDAIGFACTGSSYLVDRLEERRIVAALEDARNCAIVTAARAVAEACAALAVRRIALISPYPEWLTMACRDHWDRNGLAVTNVLQLPSGGGGEHGIYALTTETVLAPARAFHVGNADAVLVSGTGMPSLRLILALEAERKIPVLSSNLCLAWALAKGTRATSAGPESRLYGGWGDRLAGA